MKERSPIMNLVSFVAWTVVVFILIIKASKYGIIYGILASLAMILIFAFVKRGAIMFMIGQYHFNTNREKSFMWFEKAYRTNAIKPKQALFFAYLLLRDGHLDKSEKFINEMVKKYKKRLTRMDFFNADLNRALIKWKKGDLKCAIKEAEEIYNKGFRTTALYGVLGYWYILDNQLEKALEMNKEGLDYNKSDNIIIDNLAQNYFLLGDVEKAEEMYVDLLEKNPMFIEPYYNYGLVLKSKNDIEGAKKHFELALEQEEKFLSTVTHKDVENQLNTL